jgi:hypothetical protein
MGWDVGVALDISRFFDAVAGYQEKHILICLE